MFLPLSSDIYVAANTHGPHPSQQLAGLHHPEATGGQSYT